MTIRQTWFPVEFQRDFFSVLNCPAWSEYFPQYLYTGIEQLQKKKQLLIFIPCLILRLLIGEGLNGRHVLRTEGNQYTVKLGYSNIGFCDTLSIASNI
jgi:hypothetical protein